METRRRMTRNLIVLLVGLALIGLLVLVAFLSVPRVRSETPHAYRPLPATLFSRWPAVPVDGEPVRTSGMTPAQSAVPVRSGPRFSILPSGRQTAPSATKRPLVLHPPKPTATPVVGGLIPPYVGAKGLAGVATWYAYRRGQAAAAASLRNLLGPNWRGDVVRVCRGARCLDVTLTDYESSLIPGRLIDLDVNDWAALCGDPSRGICEVVVTHG
jgi:hypothetical protein